jgi:CspA family cold shock protein
MSDRISGTCKWFNNERGYGFVLEDGKEDVEYFVHFSSIQIEGYKTLKAGQKVSFELKETEKGIQATDVKVEA